MSLRGCWVPDLKAALRCESSLLFLSGNDLDPPGDPEGDGNDSDRAAVLFSLRKPSRPYDDLCYIVPGGADTLTACGFNPASKTFFVIHGWMVS